MPEQLNCLIVDDEPPAREVLKRYVEAIPSLVLVGECENAMQALSFLQKYPVQLLLLDIRMPVLMGTDFIKTLSHPPQVIFTTAHRDYAVEGFDLNAVDFLLKPISFERFLKAVNKVLQKNALDPAPPVSNFMVPEPVLSEAPAFLYLRIDRKMVKILLNEVFFLESLKDYVRIITVNGPLLVRQSLSSLEEMLPEQEFVRIHRSFIVARRHIRAYTHETMEVGNNELPIGRLYRNEVLKLL